MERLNFSDFNRFLVSLGIIFIILSIVVPWLYLRDSSSYFISAEEFRSLSVRSLELYSKNILVMLILHKIFPWISGGLVLIGLVSTTFGAKKWYAKQMIVDELDIIELEEKRYNVKTLTLEEGIEKAKKEAESNNDSEESVPYQGDIITSPKIRWEDLKEIEDHLFSRLRNDNPINYNLKRDVELRKGLVMDIVLQSYQPKVLDRIVEIVLFGGESEYQKISQKYKYIRVFANDYYKKFRRNAKAFLLVVVDDETLSKEKIDELKALIEANSESGFRKRVNTIVVIKTDFVNFDFKIFY